MRTSSSSQGRHLGGKSGLSSECSHNFICSFRNMGYNADCSNLMITWSQFCKEPLPDRSFTFWEWFYAVMKLTKEDLRGMWIDGWVDNMWSESKMSPIYLFRALLGFVSRQEAEDFLKSSDVGTFLIRFSDSELGGVTVAWSSCKMQSWRRVDREHFVCFQ